MSGRVRDPLPLTAAVAVLSTAAVLLAAGYGWLGPDVDRGANFCEASGDGWLLQPVGSLSNLGFVLAGLLVALRARRPGGLGVGTLARHPAVATSYAVVVVLLGPGSMAMHATESEVGGWLDMASMYLLAGFVAAYAAMRLTGRGTGFFLALYAALVAACLALESIARPLPVIGHSGNLVFAVLLLTGLALEAVLSRRGQGVDLRWGLASVGALSLGFVVWLGAKDGGAWCDPGSWIQGHGVWHLLCAVAAYCLFRAWAGEHRPAPRGVVLDLGNVLIDWQPLHAIAAGVGVEEARRFLAAEDFDFMAWNHGPDMGRPWDEAEAEVQREHPHWAEHALSYRPHFAASLVGEVPGTADVVRDLHAAGVPLWGLTNWSGESSTTRTHPPGSTCSACSTAWSYPATNGWPSPTQRRTNGWRSAADCRWTAWSSSTTSRSTSRPPARWGWTGSCSPTRRSSGVTCASVACPSREGQTVVRSRPSQYGLRRSRLRILPVGLRGRASRMSTDVGHLYFARCSRQ